MLPKRVLLVEDDDTVIKTHTALIKKFLGAEVTVALDAVEAVNTISSCETVFDLVIVDVNIPKGGGMVVAQFCVSEDVKLLICSGMEEYDLELNGEEYIHKLCFVDWLKDLVKAYEQKSHLA